MVVLIGCLKRMFKWNSINLVALSRYVRLKVRVIVSLEMVIKQKNYFLKVYFASFFYTKVPSTTLYLVDISLRFFKLI